MQLDSSAIRMPMVFISQTDYVPKIVKYNMYIKQAQTTYETVPSTIRICQWNFTDNPNCSLCKKEAT